MLDLKLVAVTDVIILIFSANICTLFRTYKYCSYSFITQYYSSVNYYEPYMYRPGKLEKISSTLKMPDDMIVKSKIFYNLFTSE